MTAAELPEGDNTVEPTRLEELHALLDESHQEQRAAKRTAAAATALPPSK